MAILIIYDCNSCGIWTHHVSKKKIFHGFNILTYIYINMYTNYIYRFILLQNQTSIGYTPNVNTYSLYNTATDQKLSQFQDVSVKTNYDPSSSSDNPYSNFFSAIDATYFWINGIWNQRNSWNVWPVKILSLIGSIMLVSIMQNMFIAFMRYVTYIYI